MKLTQKQIDFLNRYTIGSWSLNPKTGLVNIKGDFNCSFRKLESLQGVKFGKVSGSFDCQSNKLTSLKGAPQNVARSFDCDNNKLTSLEGAPQEVGGDFYCSHNKLTSLEGAPQEVGGVFYCGNNPIKEELWEMIWERMKGGISYFIALHSLKQEIEDFKKESKDKKSYDLLLNQIVDEDLAKGACLLGKFGIYS